MNKRKQTLSFPPSVPTIEDMSKEDFDRETRESLKRMENGEGQDIDTVFESIKKGNK